MMMDLNGRYEALCQELGRLTVDLEAIQKRRAALMDEMQILRRLAAVMTGGDHVPTQAANPEAATAAATTPRKRNGQPAPGPYSDGSGG